MEKAKGREIGELIQNIETYEECKYEIWPKNMCVQISKKVTKLCVFKYLPCEI